LNHDIAQLTRLLNYEGSPKHRIRRALSAYTEVRKQIGDKKKFPVGEQGEVLLTSTQWDALLSFYNRLVFVPPLEKFKLGVGEAAVRPFSSEEIASLSLEFENSDGFVVVDNVMTPHARHLFSEFAETATIWFDNKAGVVGAPIDTGLNAPVLAQFVDQLRNRLPDLLCEYSLIQAWAVKFDGSVSEGIELRVDECKIAVHIWISPEDEQEKELLWIDSADLVLRSTRLAHYPFTVEPSESQAIEGYNVVTVPYRANRAVFMRPFLFALPKNIQLHQRGHSDKRLILLTLLYGMRDDQCTKPAEPVPLQASAQEEGRPKISFTSSN